VRVQPIRLVCFDLGGVIVRICRSWPEGCVAAGLEVRADSAALDRLLAPCHGLVVQHQTGRLDGQRYAERMSAAINGLYTPAEVLAIHDAWLLGEYDGVIAIIDDLHGQGLITAALSNTNHEHWLRMDDYPTVGRLAHRFASHEIGHHKPDAAAFAHVEHALGLVGHEILFFDDAPENVAAAGARGWRAVAIDPQGSPAAQIAAALDAAGISVGRTPV
jgi:HAD superfamily hydrolase (TIGR01509 family)